MTGADPRPGGSHRRVDRSRRLRVLLVSLLVVVVAAGGVEAALHWRGESKRPSTNAASSGYVSPRATPARSTPSGSTSSPADAPTSTPPVTYPATSFPPVPDATTEPAATASSASPAPSTTAPAARPSVDILNATHVSGLAARADTTLTRAGWTVALTGNYPHSISATTVFYPAGQLAAAQALAAQFTAIDKTAPASAGLSTTDLTLVLAQDWTSSGK
jgi:LytR cell envelope-related transcriptional attenuator